MNNLEIIEYPISELNLLSKWRSDPHIVKFIRPGIQTFSEVQKWYSDYFSGEINKLYSIKYDKQSIGYFTIEHIDKVNHNCEFGIVIGETYLHRMGIGSSVVKLMLERAFTEMNVHRVYAVINEGNIPSVKCFVKSGFILEGRHREARLINNEFKDMLLYSILKNEWEESV